MSWSCSLRFLNPRLPNFSTYSSSLSSSLNRFSSSCYTYTTGISSLNVIWCILDPLCIALPFLSFRSKLWLLLAIIYSAYSPFLPKLSSASLWPSSSSSFSNRSSYPTRGGCLLSTIQGKLECGAGRNHLLLLYNLSVIFDKFVITNLI